MLINFNIEKLDRLLNDFYRLTGLTISIWDTYFQQLSFQPKEMSAFCRVVKSCVKGKRRCFLSDKKLCIECSRTGQVTTHRCHAGLIDIAVPIKYKDSIMGYIIFGQIAAKEKEDILPQLKKLAKDIGADTDKLIWAYEKLDMYDKSKTESAANILKLATRYLWLSEYTEIGYNAAASQIDNYIKAHISENISVRSLCNTFGLSKKRLYEISHEWFKTSIGDYISLVRIKEAKRLLCSTDYPINEIAYMVGIRDYNYFTKFFKAHVGTPPLRYRKEFPFNIHDEEEGLSNFSC